MKLGDPKVNRWGNGQPFDYRAGFRGDEMMYNSENGIWHTGYAGPAALPVPARVLQLQPAAHRRRRAARHEDHRAHSR